MFGLETSQKLNSSLPHVALPPIFSLSLCFWLWALSLDDDPGLTAPSPWGAYLFPREVWLGAMLGECAGERLCSSSLDELESTCLFFYWEWSRTAIFKWGCWKCISLSSVLFGLVGLPVDSLIACNLLTVRSTAVSGNYASGVVELLCVLKYALRIDQVVLCFPLLRRKLRSKLVDMFHSTFPLIA